MKKLSLVILDGKRIVEATVISWTRVCWEKIIPRRKPDREGKKGAAWIIEKEKRRVFGKHAVKMLEEFNEASPVGHSEEELYGFFGIVGIGSRWADNEDIRWCLYLGEKDLAPGMAL